MRTIWLLPSMKVSFCFLHNIHLFTLDCMQIADFLPRCKMNLHLPVAEHQGEAQPCKMMMQLIQMSASLVPERSPASSLFFKVCVTSGFTAYFVPTSYLLLQEGFSGPFQFFFQLIQLDVPTATKRTASGSKWPYLVEMNIHLFWIIISTVLLLIDKRIYVVV